MKFSKEIFGFIVVGVIQKQLCLEVERVEIFANSDVDLIVEFSTKAVSLFTLSGLMLDLEEIFGVGVDVIHGPKKDSWLIKIYAA